MLHQWLLGLFGVSSFERLDANLKDPALEGFDENNVSRFYHALCLHTPTDKRGAKSDEAYTCKVMDKTANARNLNRGDVI
ncbi:hypothetical protein [Roseiflexus castenholzii]|uniref:hypothetical protein n=1 Tax=Roseiflexus castenholzii TaxID=120962 RepID=UPI003C7C4460